MCDAHWPLLPEGLQRRLRHRYRHGRELDRRPSILWLAAARSAIDAIADLERHAATGDQAKSEIPAQPPHGDEEPRQSTYITSAERTDAGDRSEQPQTGGQEGGRRRSGSGAESPTDQAERHGLVLMPYHAAPDQEAAE
jgi:hypothetical protein